MVGDSEERIEGRKLVFGSDGIDRPNRPGILDASSRIVQRLCSAIGVVFVDGYIEDVVAFPVSRLPGQFWSRGTGHFKTSQLVGRWKGGLSAKTNSLSLLERGKFVRQES